VLCEWDDRKAIANLKKHGVSFQEATTVMSDVLSLTVPDIDHSESEDRYLTIGRSTPGRLIVVSHTERNSVIRIISARLATKIERADYESENR
jgi:uncharacterized DUF497 family protein